MSSLSDQLSSAPGRPAAVAAGETRSRSRSHLGRRPHRASHPIPTRPDSARERGRVDRDRTQCTAATGHDLTVHPRRTCHVPRRATKTNGRGGGGGMGRIESGAGCLMFVVLSSAGSRRAGIFEWPLLVVQVSSVRLSGPRAARGPRAAGFDTVVRSGFSLASVQELV